MSGRNAAVIVCIAILAVAIASRLNAPPQHPSAPGATDASVAGVEPMLSPQMFLGNPSGATPDAGNRANYLMLKPYYALAFNDPAGEPRWVSWRLTADDLGSAPRSPKFDADTSLPLGFNVVVSRDYNETGFDRGHMCPHSDRAANTEMSYATFCMTNIIPQAPNVNRESWAQLEEYCRDLVRRQHERLFITSGPYGQGGRGSKGAAQSFARGRVVVPAECWKVIVAVPDEGTDDLAEVQSSARVIAVDMPNDQEVVGEEWAGFRCSPAEIEGKTGLHFFTRLPSATRAAMETKVDREYVPPPVQMKHEGD